ncbi:uncharacterized protein LOC133200503 [Saccostrea echinata]|uniref:uncharacterized protein LOC133200503 n=1 Tax=Saccostrea echinata TaxID=191078 RepID=UPI002A84047E|nr:uncharacterized protein LOC133200503 [Saccostrea echinata]
MFEEITDYLKKSFVIIAPQKSPCPHSLTTAKYNVKCPATKREWGEREKISNCEQYEQNCTVAEKYRYHCVLNAIGNGTVELCAPVVDIIGGQCTEFTVGGQFLQEHTEKKCKSCPFKYISSNVYKYKECFQLKKEEKQASHAGINKNVHKSTLTASKRIQFSTTPSSEGFFSMKGDKPVTQIKDNRVHSEEQLEDPLIIFIVTAVVFFLILLIVVVLFIKLQAIKRTTSLMEKRINTEASDVKIFEGNKSTI